MTSRFVEADELTTRRGMPQAAPKQVSTPVHPTHPQLNPDREEVEGEPRMTLSNPHRVFFTVAQLAERWQVTPCTVYTWIRNGHLKASKLGPGKNSPLRVSRYHAVSFEKAETNAQEQG